MLSQKNTKSSLSNFIELQIEEQFARNHLTRINEASVAVHKRNYRKIMQIEGRYYLLDINEDGSSTVASVLEHALEEDSLNNKVNIFFYLLQEEHYHNGLTSKAVTFLFPMQPEALFFTPLADAFWQTACGLIISTIRVDANFGLRDIVNNPVNGVNITSQVGYPIIFGLFAGIYRYVELMDDYKKKLGRELISEECWAIQDHCIAYAAKVALSIGGWEAGLFVGQCLITLFSLSSAFGIPLLLAFCSGLGQAMTATVINGTWDTKLFCSNFFGGMAWQACSLLVPFLSSLSAFDDVLGGSVKRGGASIVAGITTFFAERWINDFVPKAIDGVYTGSCRFFSYVTSVREDIAKPTAALTFSA